MPIKNDTYAPPRKSHDAMMKKEWMRDPAFKAEYDSLEKEYAHAVGCELIIHLKPFARKKA